MNNRSVANFISTLSGPIVEIGGPTPEGYLFVDQLNCALPSKPIVTNISKTITINPFGDNPQTYTVDEVVAVQSMPYTDDSIGMLIACALPIADSDKFQSFNSSDDRRDYLAQQKQQAIDEYASYESGKGFTLNLHIALIEAARRVLLPDGLLVLEYGLVQDKQVAAANGMLLRYESPTGDVYIFQKQ